MHTIDISYKLNTTEIVERNIDVLQEFQKRNQLNNLRNKDLEDLLNEMRIYNQLDDIKVKNEDKSDGLKIDNFESIIEKIKDKDNFKIHIEQLSELTKYKTLDTFQTITTLDLFLKYIENKEDFNNYIENLIKVIKSNKAIDIPDNKNIINLFLKYIENENDFNNHIDNFIEIIKFNKLNKIQTETTIKLFLDNMKNKYNFNIYINRLLHFIEHHELNNSQANRILNITIKKFDINNKKNYANIFITLQNKYSDIFNGNNSGKILNLILKNFTKEEVKIYRYSYLIYYLLNKVPDNFQFNKILKVMFKNIEIINHLDKMDTELFNLFISSNNIYKSKLLSVFNNGVESDYLFILENIFIFKEVKSFKNNNKQIDFLFQKLSNTFFLKECEEILRHSIGDIISKLIEMKVLNNEQIDYLFNKIKNILFMTTVEDLKKLNIDKFNNMRIQYRKILKILIEYNKSYKNKIKLIDTKVENDEAINNSTEKFHFFNKIFTFFKTILNFILIIFNPLKWFNK